MKQKSVLRCVGLLALTFFGGMIGTAFAQALDPTKGQLFHTREGGGGLIEGAVTKILDDGIALVKMTAGSNVNVPLELFEDTERQAICSHFNVQVPDPTMTTETDRGVQHPWHSFRGGVICYGQIVSVHDGVMKVVNTSGEQFRIPMGMLAQGAYAKAEKDIAKLNPSHLTTSKRPARNSQQQNRKSKEQEASGNGEQPSDQDDKQDETTTKAPTIGNHRKWINTAGEVLAVGKFRRGQADKIVIVDSKGGEQEFALSDLGPPDQNYIRLIENGAVIDPANDSSAVPEGKPTNGDANAGRNKPMTPATQKDPNLPPGLANALDNFNKTTKKDDPTPSQQPDTLGNYRHWKNSSGEILATGKFRRRTDQGKLTIINDKGEEQEIEYGKLNSNDQIYVQSVEAGARIDIVADSSAIQREIPADSLRTWKTMGGVPLATGEFVELKAGQVTVFQADQTTRQLPMDLLSDADRQYAEAMASGEGPGKAPEGSVAIASETARIIPSLDGKSLLLVDQAQLKVLSPDGMNVIGTYELPENTTQIAERAEYYVVAAGKQLVLLDKETLETIGVHELWKFQKINDIALHPKRKVAFLSVENSADEIRNDERERHRIVMVDENTGKANMLGSDYANWLLIDPSGAFLLAGYKDVDQRFGGFHVNPDGNVIEQPKWENTDILRRYRIEKDSIVLDQEFPEAGANGQGLVMSNSGKQIAYLSFTGYPTLSYNIALFDVKNFEKKPVTLATKNVATCKKLALHPTAPLAASPGGDAVVFFGTRSGKVHAKQPEIAPELKGAAIHELVFSGDGQFLVVQASKGGGERFVWSIGVKGPTSAAGQGDIAEATEPSNAAETKRVWTDKSGQFKVEAEFVGLEGDNVRLKKADGSIIEVPLLKLAAKDQVIARKLAAEE